jgi:hypothetical protein
LLSFLAGHVPLPEGKVAEAQHGQALETLHQYLSASQGRPGYIGWAP